VSDIEPVDIRFGPSTGPQAHSAALSQAFSKNTVPGQLHYATTRQSAAWMEVQKKHAPSGLAEFYKSSHDWLIQHIAPRKNRPLCLISHGCGSGWKEADLLSTLKKNGVSTNLLLADISADLVASAMRAAKLASPGADIRGYAGDIRTEQSFISGHAPEGSRLHLFFGILPNCEISQFRALLESAVRSGEMAVFSVNLLNAHATNIAREIATVRAQYDNAEMRQWLRLLPADWGWQLRPEEIDFTQEPQNPSPEDAEPVTFRFSAVVPADALTLPEDVTQPTVGSRLEFFFTQRFWHKQLDSILDADHWETLAARHCPATREALILVRKI
jgi:hypothetical protein